MMLKFLQASTTVVAVLCLVRDTGVKADCIIEGDMAYATGAELRTVGYQCMGDGVTFGGELETCGDDGSIIRTKGMYTCPSGTFCEMCGPTRRGAAMCVSTSLAEQGIDCSFPTNYSAEGCFTYSNNNAVVPAGTQMGDGSVIGCTDDGRLEEAYLVCGDNWFPELVYESKSCPENAPVCSGSGDSARCVAQASAAAVVATTVVSDSSNSTNSTSSVVPDGCVSQNVFYQVGAVVKIDKWECTSNNTFTALKHTCESGGGVIGNSYAGTCAAGIQPYCHQCGDPAAGAALCSNSSVPPDGCSTGGDYAESKNITTLGRESGGGENAPLTSVMCTDENDNAFKPGDLMSSVGFECTSSSVYEGKRVVCGDDGNPSKDSSIVALSCQSGTYCYQCGMRSPGAAICASSSPDDSECTLVASDDSQPSAFATGSYASRLMPTGLIFVAGLAAALAVSF